MLALDMVEKEVRDLLTAKDGLFSIATDKKYKKQNSIELRERASVVRSYLIKGMQYEGHYLDVFLTSYGKRESISELKVKDCNIPNLEDPTYENLIKQPSIVHVEQLFGGENTKYILGGQHLLIFGASGQLRRSFSMVNPVQIRDRVISVDEFELVFKSNSLQNHKVTQRDIHDFCLKTDASKLSQTVQSMFNLCIIPHLDKLRS